MRDCHVLVDLGMTKPNSKFHSSRQRPRYRTLCSSLGNAGKENIQVVFGVKLCQSISLST